ncbi:unnamed protein product, partial [Ectocarpus sp. 6 AP-2014]
PPPTPISYSAPLLLCLSNPALSNPSAIVVFCPLLYPPVRYDDDDDNRVFSPPLPQSDQGIGRLLQERQIAGGCQGEQGPRGPAQRDQAGRRGGGGGGQGSQQPAAGAEPDRRQDRTDRGRRGEAGREGQGRAGVRERLRQQPTSGRYGGLPGVGGDGAQDGVAGHGPAP